VLIRARERGRRRKQLHPSAARAPTWPPARPWGAAPAARFAPAAAASSACDGSGSCSSAAAASRSAPSAAASPSPPLPRPPARSASTARCSADLRASSEKPAHASAVLVAAVAWAGGRGRGGRPQRPAARGAARGVPPPRAHDNGAAGAHHAPRARARAPRAAPTCRAHGEPRRAPRGRPGTGGRELRRYEVPLDHALHHAGRGVLQHARGRLQLLEQRRHRCGNGTRLLLPRSHCLYNRPNTLSPAPKITATGLAQRLPPPLPRPPPSASAGSLLPNAPALGRSATPRGRRPAPRRPPRAARRRAERRLLPAAAAAAESAARPRLARVWTPAWRRPRRRPTRSRSTPTRRAAWRRRARRCCCWTCPRARCWASTSRWGGGGGQWPWICRRRGRRTVCGARPLHRRLPEAAAAARLLGPGAPGRLARWPCPRVPAPHAVLGTTPALALLDTPPVRCLSWGRSSRASRWCRPACTSCRTRRPAPTAACPRRCRRSWRCRRAASSCAAGTPRLRALRHWPTTTRWGWAGGAADGVGAGAHTGGAPQTGSARRRPLGGAAAVRVVPARIPPIPPLAPQAERYAEGVRRFDFDAGLAPYDLAACGAWRDLTSCIDEALLKRLLPVCGRGSPARLRRGAPAASPATAFDARSSAPPHLVPTSLPPTPLQVGGEISVMAEALDPDLMHPRTAAERRLVAQLEVGPGACGAGVGRRMAAGRGEQPPLRHASRPPTSFAATLSPSAGGPRAAAGAAGCWSTSGRRYGHRCAAGRARRRGLLVRARRARRRRPGADALGALLLHAPAPPRQGARHAGCGADSAQPGQERGAGAGAGRRRRPQRQGAPRRAAVCLCRLLVWAVAGRWEGRGGSKGGRGLGTRACVCSAGPAGRRRT
jgi:hypothetical protein